MLQKLKSKSGEATIVLVALVAGITFLSTRAHYKPDAKVPKEERNNASGWYKHLQP